MNITGRKVLVLGGPGLVGIAVCRELLERKPAQVQIHGLYEEETEMAREELLPEAGSAHISLSYGDIFGLEGGLSRQREIAAQLDPLQDDDLPSFRLYRLLTDGRPDIVIDCVNTATGIAYRDIFRSSSKLKQQLESGQINNDTVADVLESLYIPRLIRHIQVLYRGMTAAGTSVYIKVGTSGTGGMGLNIPYTHSEERPSRVLLSKSAVAGAQSLLLFLMARTPGAPITKEIKPAAAIAWKQIRHGPISRRREPIYLMDAAPRPLGETISTFDPQAARQRDQILETVFIDTGENGIFSLEEFALLTTAEQMEFVTPEEIAQYLVFEIEGGNTGHDIINALDNAVLGPTYRAGMLRHWAMERMLELEQKHATHSIAFEMLGPARNSKLLFEAHLLRLAFGSMTAVREATPEEVAERLDRLVREQPESTSQAIAVGVPVLLASGELLRGTRVIVPADAENLPVTPERLEAWVHDGWVDLRRENCATWIDRFQAIHDEIEAIPDSDTSSRHLRNPRFWDHETLIRPGRVVGWVLSVEERGARFK